MDSSDGYWSEWVEAYDISTDCRHVQSAADFIAFIQAILAQLALLNIHNKIFLWDNLSSHKSAAVINAVYEAGLIIIERPAYFPEDGPIEFLFDEIEQSLRYRLYNIRTSVDLLTNVHQIIRDLGANFNATFAHCKY